MYKGLSHFINFKALFLSTSSFKKKYFVVFYKKRMLKLY